MGRRKSAFIIACKDVDRIYAKEFPSKLSQKNLDELVRPANLAYKIMGCDDMNKKIPYFVVLVCVLAGCNDTSSRNNSIGLQYHSCLNTSDRRSVLGEDRLVIRLVNTQNDELNVYWIDYDGKEVYYKTLKSGEAYDQPTYVSHPWVIRDKKQKCIKIFTPVGESLEVKL